MSDVYIKNPKGRIVSVSKEAAEYLLSSNPNKNIYGREILDDKNRPVKIKKSQHEEGFTEPTKEELDAFLKADKENAVANSSAAADDEQKKADKEAKKAAEAQAKADAKKAEAEKKAKEPTPDN